MSHSNQPTAPIAKRIPYEHSIHNDIRTDPYFWLKHREDTAVLDYLSAENEYTKESLRPVEGFQQKLFDELKGRVKEKDATVPYLSNGYYYYKRFEEGGEYPFFCRKQGSIDSDEEVLLDVNELAKEHEFFSVGGQSISPDNRYLLYGEDNIGRRLYTLKLIDLHTGQYCEDTIPNTSGSAAWANDNATVFYTAKDIDTLRSFKVMRHRIGTPVAEDEVVFEEKDDTFYAGVYRCHSDAYLFIFSSSTLTSEHQFLSVNDAHGDFKMIQARTRGIEYDVEHAGDRFYIRTNTDQATNFKLVSCDIHNSTKEYWVDVLPHREDILLEDVLCFKDYLTVQERIRGISEIRILPWTDLNKGFYISHEEEAHSIWFGANEQFDTTTLRFIYSSLTTPVSTFDINMANGDRILLRERPVLGGFDKEDYDSERIWVTVRDGVEVPVSIVYRKGFKKDGTQPLLLYAYGSYGSSTDPYFSSNRLSLLDRGFVFAIAHVRGGQEMGRKWYENGKLLKKKNTFYDFIDCGDFLKGQLYCDPQQLFAMGGSAGGLLMGAIVNLRPDLWKGVVAAVPFVDVVTTMLDDSIPLTTFEYDEWGNPNQQEYYDYIKSYSPYDNVAAGDFPNILVTTGLHDSQVQYWEPAKWVAKMRSVKTDNNLLLLKTNMDAGHGGASGRFKQFREIALDYAFLLYLTGITE